MSDLGEPRVGMRWRDVTGPGLPAGDGDHRARALPGLGGDRHLARRHRPPDSAVHGGGRRHPGRRRGRDRVAEGLWRAVSAVVRRLAPAALAHDLQKANRVLSQRRTRLTNWSSQTSSAEADRGPCRLSYNLRREYAERGISAPPGPPEDQADPVSATPCRWTVGVVVVPAILLAAAVLYVVPHPPRTELLKIALEPQSLRWIAVGCVAAIVVWVALILTTYHRTRPARPTRRQNAARLPARDGALDGRRRARWRPGPTTRW